MLTLFRSRSPAPAPEPIENTRMVCECHGLEVWKNTRYRSFGHGECESSGWGQWSTPCNEGARFAEKVDGARKNTYSPSDPPTPEEEAAWAAERRKCNATVMGIRELFKTMNCHEAFAGYSKESMERDKPALEQAVEDCLERVINGILDRREARK